MGFVVYFELFALWLLFLLVCLICGVEYCWLTDCFYVCLELWGVRNCGSF